ncbi:hypothetical protein, partial [Thiolapillus sp.]|uniref:hypothetical protein n=1 Tax=Thiolapillus sp. TaxID=2017437 RepID=UPI003AF6FFC0
QWRLLVPHKALEVCRRLWLHFLRLMPMLQPAVMYWQMRLAVVTAVTQTEGQVAAECLEPGFRFNVIVTKDMAFSKPYQAFDY